jgi:monoamine oxidase
MSIYDVIIVGAGISGLRTGIEILRRHPRIRCCILEQYYYTGGRMTTYHTRIPSIGSVQWEAGAGRIARSHIKTLELMKKYDCDFIPISNENSYLSYPSLQLTTSTFSSLLQVYLEPLRQLPANVLASHTIGELLEKIVGPKEAKSFYLQFPYDAEIHTLRADCALASFANEMGDKESFGVCGGGLSKLIESMSKEFTKRGGSIYHGSIVKRVFHRNDIIHLETKQTAQNGTSLMTVYRGQVGILALPSHAVQHLKGIHLPILKHIEMRPLFRMYAVFPLHKGKAWFAHLGKIVTNSTIRYIIPINPSKGTIMISYTDGKDAAYWMRQERSHIQDMILHEIRQLFPDLFIPDPLFFKLHDWKHGCSYWLPGSYSVEEESAKSLQPLPNRMPHLFMCSESFAVRQCWIESALEQADALLESSSFQKSLKLLNKKYI